MPVLELPRVHKAAPLAPAVRPSHWRGVVLFGGLAVLYFTVGCLLMMRYNLFDPDAPSRVANAGYVVDSRDPHLSAVGFVWNPLPSLVEIPVLQLSRWFPELRTHGLAGVVQSALFMAGAAVMIDRIAVDRRVAVVWRRLSIAAFALQPMIVVYGGSGMSEAAETFCVLWCVRRLMLWTDTRRPVDLASAGLALGVGYLTRYEVVPAAVGAAAFVGVVTVLGTPHARTAKASANVAIVMFPIVITAVAWALSGWVVNQELFATLSSGYGNDSIVAASLRRSAQRLPAGFGDWVSIAARTFGMQPFVGIAVVAAVIHAAFTRTVTALVPVVILGPILVFAAWGQYSSATFGCFRYYLLAIPLVICLALALWTPADSPPKTHPSRLAEERSRRFGAVLLCASVLIGFPVTVLASLNPRIGNQPLQFGFNSLLFPGTITPEGPQQVWYRRLMIEDRALAGHLDRLALPDGAVLMDTFNTWGVWMTSAHPRQFVITSDLDFKAALNRPWEHGVQYLLVSNPDSTDADALTVRYPTLWNDGAGISRLVYRINGAGGEERFRLYRATGPPKRAGAPSVGSP